MKRNYRKSVPEKCGFEFESIRIPFWFHVQLKPLHIHFIMIFSIQSKKLKRNSNLSESVPIFLIETPLQECFFNNPIYKQ